MRSKCGVSPISSESAEPGPFHCIIVCIIMLYFVAKYQECIICNATGHPLNMHMAVSGIFKLRLHHQLNIHAFIAHILLSCLADTGAI